MWAKEMHLNCFSLFIKDLERYADSPEDVGHCFVTWVRRMRITKR